MIAAIALFALGAVAACAVPAVILAVAVVMRLHPGSRRPEPQTREATAAAWASRERDRWIP